MRPPSAEELTRKWGEASWSLHDPSKPYEYDSLDLRLRRAISWLERAEAEKSRADEDAGFIFHWIAFNAMYSRLGTSSTGKTDEKKERRKYFGGIVKFNDSQSVIFDTIWSVLWNKEIKAILDNKYVFEPFWRDHNNQAKSPEWKQEFQKAQDDVKQALRKTRTKYVLCELFDRLYTLRNQLLHGGATWNGSMNRSQVTTGARIMSSLIPHFIDVMIRHPDGWGAPRYPVVREAGPQSGYHPTD